jgi:plastocyanin
MRAIQRTTSAVAAALLLAACSGNPPAATGNPPAATGNPPAATGGAPGATIVATICTPASGGAADVNATVADNAWGPVSAAVGEVITWSNEDSRPHKVALDDGSCTMTNNITREAQQSLVFTQAGSFPFHCTIHSFMKGTITIS